MKKSLLNFSLAVCACVLALGQEPETKPAELKNGASFKSGDIPRVVETRLGDGESVSFTLFENVTTGYQWFASGATNACPATIDHRGPSRPKTGEPIPCGAPGSAVVSIKRLADAPSPSVVKLEYKRAWEKNVEPAFSIEVRVVSTKNEK